MSKAKTAQRALKPALLTAGATWGVVGLSSPCEPERFLKAKQGLSSFGFHLKVALDPCCGYGKDTHMFSSAPPRERARALTELFQDKSVSAIIAARGGYGSMEVLPYLDFDLIRANPKAIVGFSDTTAILVALYEKAGIVSFHGPALEGAFGRLTEDERSRKSAEELLSFFTKGLSASIDVELQTVAGRTVDLVRAPLIGGNLTTISHLLGTPWEGNFANHIVFLEDIAEKPYSIHRMLLQMKLAGKFEHASGVVLGQFSECAHEKGQGPVLARVFEDIFAEAAFPVLGYAPFGHKSLNLVMPLGAEGLIQNARFRLAESPFA